MTTPNKPSMNRLSKTLALAGLLGCLGLTLVQSCSSSQSPAPAPGAGSGGSSGSGGAPGRSGGAPGSGGASAGTGGAGTGGAPGPAPGTGGAVVTPGPGGARSPTGGASGTPGDASPPGPADGKTTVVLFLIDGLSPDAARTAAANGASNLKAVIEGGVTVETALSTTPAARTVLPGGSLPWGNATSGNIAVHTGTHVYEAGAMGLEDIFTATRKAGIKSIFSGGDANYMAFTTADFHYAAGVSDQVVVQQAINHLKKDKVRLLRLHLQRIRDDWSGPGDKTNPASAYIKHIVASDALLGQLIAALKEEGVWESTYLVITADHGMGQSTGSSHIASTRSSWDIFMAFQGPDIKKGATIPYAELPDVAVTTMRFFKLPALKGHSSGPAELANKGPTGTVLTNLFVGAPTEVTHPRYVDAYLKMNTFPGSGDMYLAYRSAMLGLIK